MKKESCLFVYLFDFVFNCFVSQLSALELNNTRHAKKEVLFFNRVPKVGSQTTMELLKALSIKNQFKYHKDRTQKVETIKLTYNEEVIKPIMITTMSANYSNVILKSTDNDSVSLSVCRNLSFV